MLYMCYAITVLCYCFVSFLALRAERNRLLWIEYAVAQDTALDRDKVLTSVQRFNAWIDVAIAHEKLVEVGEY